MGLSIDRVMVDKDIIIFLKTVLLGKYSDPIEAASSRAYNDMCRTLKFEKGKKLDNDKLELRRDVNELLRPEIKKLNISNIKCQDDFDEWHKSLCEDIQAIYKEKNICITIGQAQKWVNMTIKYLYMLEENSFEDIFDYLHVPLDNYVFSAAKKKLGIATAPKPWSRISDYDVYLDYQKEIRERLSGKAPLRWEFRSWIEARNQGL